MPGDVKAAERDLQESAFASKWEIQNLENKRF